MMWNAMMVAPRSVSDSDNTHGRWLTLTDAK